MSASTAETITRIREQIARNEQLLNQMCGPATAQLLKRRQELQQALVYWLALEVVEGVRE